MKSTALLAPLFAFVCASIAGAQANDPQLTETAIDELVASVRAEKHIPGLAVMVARNGDVVFSKGYGLESVERAVPMTTDSVLPIASVSKIFTGTVLMMMVEDGLLSLDHSLDRWFPNMPDDKKAITVRHLVSHTHGLADYYHSERFSALPEDVREAMTAPELIAWVFGEPVRNVAGEEFAYSLAGYVILQQVLEKIAGKPFEEIVAERIFAPLGLSTAYYGGSDVIVPGRFALTYEWKDGGLAYHKNDFPQITFAAGGLNISVADLMQFLLALETGQLMGDQSRAEMWRAYPVADESKRFYSLAWFSYTRRKDGRFVVGHEGGGSSWLVYLPDERLAVVALSNMSGARADALPQDISYRFLGRVAD